MDGKKIQTKKSMNTEFFIYFDSKFKKKKKFNWVIEVFFLFFDDLSTVLPIYQEMYLEILSSSNALLYHL